MKQVGADYVSRGKDSGLHMMWWQHGDYMGRHGGDFGAVGILWLILMILLWAAVITAIVLVIRSLILHGGRSHGAAQALPPAGTAQAGAGQGNPQALQILEERYARGELDREDYLRRRADLTGKADSAGPSTGP